MAENDNFNLDDFISSWAQFDEFIQSIQDDEIKMDFLDLIYRMGRNKTEKCLICNRDLSIENKSFRLKGTGNYYSGGDLDGVKVDGWICPECVENLILNKRKGVGAVA